VIRPIFQEQAQAFAEGLAKGAARRAAEADAAAAAENEPSGEVSTCEIKLPASADGRASSSVMLSVTRS
jgi:hypothetical protein